MGTGRRCLPLGRQAGTEKAEYSVIDNKNGMLIRFQVKYRKVVPKKNPHIFKVIHKIIGPKPMQLG